ncbi:MAG: hypothetical protein ACRCZF_20570, partial [Gemmataceae bacterium]
LPGHRIGLPGAAEAPAEIVLYRVQVRHGHAGSIAEARVDRPPNVWALFCFTPLTHDPMAQGEQ